MARSFSSVKVLADSVSMAINRRCFSGAATQQSGGATTIMRAVKKQVEVTKEESWVPDPKTGYYRPENRADEIDVAELRQMFLNNKKQNPTN